MSNIMVEEKSPDEKFFGQVRLKQDDSVDFNDPENILTMKNIHKTYLLGIEGVPALRGVSMSIKRGEFICIFGTSGGGKTTMLNIIGTIDKPTKGDMKLCGKMINHKTTDKDLAFLRLKNIGFVFQTFNLLSSLTALENVEMPMILLGELSASERRERAISLLTKVGMKDRLDHFPSQLSGGEQQRVTIARAIANNPDILLLDEPTGDLDTVNTSIIMKLLTDLNKNENITLVMVTHDVGLKMYSDRIIWMRDGKIQRIETVPLKSKEDQFQKLYKEVDSIQRNQKNGVHSVFVSSNSDENENQVMNNNNNNSSSSSSSNSNSKSKISEYRKPTDYKSIASYTSPVEINFNAAQNILKSSTFNNNNSKNNNDKNHTIIESSSISPPYFNNQSISSPASTDSLNNIANATIYGNSGDVYLDINENNSLISKNDQDVDSLSKNIERIL
ncbi:hypothetical protein CYY_001218 [Polysphondylium violaceum]|uniref:ABC transporter domain-containing protein n=1 Tax=Polysphondylium violaceum TaxID=133409 RepID=A0A8J4V1S8_9MYCE|nr:hypothetical protein CYY_001218 [Polysphondylium violaceum]